MDLGKAYVQIMPSAKGISGSIQSAIAPEATAAGKKAGESIASSIAKSMGNLGETLTSKITKPAAGAAAAVAGLVGALGFKRLIGMDNAQAKLKGLGIEGKQLEIVMKNASDAVTGTTHTMAEGVDVAAGALAAGIKEGQDLERVIKLVGDAATGANRPMGEMSPIFNRIIGSGKLMTQELNMIEHSMPGFAQAMADHVADGSMEAFRTMVTNGAVGSSEFLDVMEDFAGGMSDAFAGTWSGMAKNVLSNIGILGERMLGGLFDDGKKGIESLLEVLRSDKLRNWAESAGVAMREFIQGVVDGVKQVKKWWDDLSPSLQETIKQFSLFGTAGIIAIGPILKVAEKLITFFGTILIGAGKVGGGIAAIASPVGLVIAAIGVLVGGFVYFFNTNEEFRESVIKIWENIKDTIINAWETVIDYITPAIESVVEFVMEVWGHLVTWWTDNNEMILEAAENVWGFISKVIELAMDIIVGIMKFVWPFVEMLIKQVWGNIKGIISGAVDVLTGVINFFAALFTGNWSELWESVKQILSGAVEFLWNLVNLYLIGRILGVARNFAGIFGNLFRGAWNTVRGLFSGGLNAIRNLITSGFNGIRNIITGGLEGALNVIRNFLGRFKDAGRRIVTSIADGIKGSISAVTGAIGDVAGSIRSFLPFSPAKEGPLKDLNKLDFGGTISLGIEKGESAVARSMEDMLAFDLTKKATFNVPHSYDNGGRDITIHNTFTAKEMTPSEIARKQKQQLQNMVLGW